MPAASLDRSAEPALTRPTTMLAIIQARYGTSPKEVLCIQLVPTSEADDDEVLVEVRASSVDLGTCHPMSGSLQYPICLGAGVVRPKALNPGRPQSGRNSRVRGAECDRISPRRLR